MKDVWDYKMHEDFANGYIMDVNVNTYSNNKVYACWHILDRYRGHYINRNLTRNMVDIKVTVPEMNIVYLESISVSSTLPVVKDRLTAWYPRS